MHVVFTYRIRDAIIPHITTTTYTEEVKLMTAVGILLLILGVIGMLLGSLMIGDIGLAAMIGSAASILSGIGFLLCNRRLKRMEAVRGREKAKFANHTGS